MILLSLAALVVVVALLVRPGFTPAIRKPGLATLERLKWQGVEQWLLIRTRDVDNPVLLFVHGGPGTSQLTLNRRNTEALEERFTVVNWDQRGAGKSYRAIHDRDRMHLEQFVDDVIELSQQLAARFHQPKITLVGHSWGSLISVLAVKKRPELFHAYVGIGQMSDAAEGERISWEWTLAQARAAGDEKSVRKLEAIGPPPYTGDWRPKLIAERRLLGKYGGEFHGSRSGALGVVIKNLLFSPEYTLVDRFNYFRGILGSMKLLMPELSQRNLFLEAPELEVPVYFMLGRHDFEVPSVLSAKYFEALEAPKKSLTWFEHSAHMPNTEERERFNRMLLELVLPSLPGGSTQSVRSSSQAATLNPVDL